ncbi:MAG: hypothetical protein EAZ97_06390 [Bacteroidetes bacterium]|nr:MAG: hypothetical protein EAZ97_06390 [Bacteroidota bacterium]
MKLFAIQHIGNVCLLLFVFCGTIFAQDSTKNAPQKSVSDVVGSLGSVLDLEENLSFLQAANEIIASLHDIHEVAMSKEEDMVKKMTHNGNLRRIMNKVVECRIPFQSPGATTTTKEHEYLSSFIAVLDSINNTYNLRYNSNLSYEIAIFGYTDQRGTEAKNKEIADSRAKNSATFLAKMAKEKNLKLNISTIQGKPNESPDGKASCEKDDPSCRVCKIVLVRLLP